MIKHKQINNVKKEKLNCNTVYISFSVYNINIDIHYVNAFFSCNDAGITLGYQQVYNCGSQMKLCT